LTDKRQVLCLEGFNTRTQKRDHMSTQEQLSNTSTFSKTSENKLKKRGKRTEMAGSTPVPHMQN